VVNTIIISLYVNTLVGHIKHTSWLQQLVQCWTRNSKPKRLELSLFATQCFTDWQKLGDNKSVTVLFFISRFLAPVTVCTVL